MRCRVPKTPCVASALQGPGQSRCVWEPCCVLGPPLGPGTPSVAGVCWGPPVWSVPRGVLADPQCMRGSPEPLVWECPAKSRGPPVCVWVRCGIPRTPRYGGCPVGSRDPPVCVWVPIPWSSFFPEGPHQTAPRGLGLNWRGFSELRRVSSREGLPGKANC